jgi:hypothetical protein
MGSLQGTKVGAFFLFMAISVFPAFGQNAATTPNAAAQRAMYPESADGLKSLITDLLTAIKSSDTLKSSQLLTSLDLPNHREWFLKSFGVTEAPTSKPNMSSSQPRLPIGCKRDWKESQNTPRPMSL